MAKRFKFSLEAVLDVRKRLEDEKQQIVARKQRALDLSQNELKSLNDDFRLNSDRLRSEHRELDAEGLRLHYGHLQFLDRAITAQIRVVAERRIELERARVELLEASKERKVVEKLKERRREAFVIEELRIEQNELDDGNARRYGRAVQAGGTQP
ncbi:MAG TPA: flagellar export protein FliJ [Candidatus Baltobacteraceae bacterium]|jgi:flagellar FliJ protein|nr:flagellar export protein FliJ [Candidatus Baltobacteraceae bacterium]